MREATIAERLSFSPILSSSTATASFSFTIGTAPMERRVVIVVRELMQRERSRVSSRVRSTCAATRERAEKSSA